MSNPIHERDGGRCVVHGDAAETVHHRDHHHGNNRPSTRVATCGPGTTGAHGWIEANPAAAGLLEDGPGWTVTRHGADTTQIPMWMEAGPYGKGWYLLDDEYGFWAATSRYQRLQLSRLQQRVKCPGCLSQAVAVDSYGQTCLACGLSWLIKV